MQIPDASTKGKRLHDGEPSGLTTPLQDEITRRDKKIDTLNVSKLEEREDEREHYSRRNYLRFWTDITEEKEEIQILLPFLVLKNLELRLN